MSTTSGSSPGLLDPERHSNLASRFPQDVATTNGFKVLIVDPDPAMGRACSELGSKLGVSILAVNTFAAAETALLRQQFDLLLLDVDLNHPPGVQQLADIRTSHPETMVVVVSASATVTAAVQAMRLGATDYLRTPMLINELTDVIERAMKQVSRDVQARTAQRQLANGSGMGALVGQSLAMQKLYRIITKVAFTSHPVLILGDSGTGKELVARTIHAAGPNASRPFVPIYCNTLTAETMERELFGHAKGAVPGATRARAGMLVEADSGTVLFHGIHELPLELQGKLVRVLQERHVRPVGSQDRVPIHARIIASADSNLPDLQRDGKFRRDLFFRLNIVNIKVPSLKERRDDIVPLTNNILRGIRQDSSIPYEVDTAVRDLLNSYDWPGNVRELESVLQRACVMASSSFLTEKDLPSQLLQHVPPEPATLSERTIPASGPFKVASIAEMEKQAILNTIQQLRGDKLKAARLLGIGKTTLYRKLKEYGIETTSPD